MQNKKEFVYYITQIDSDVEECIGSKLYIMLYTIRAKNLSALTDRYAIYSWCYTARDLYATLDLPNNSYIVSLRYI